MPCSAEFMAMRSRSASLPDPLTGKRRMRCSAIAFAAALSLCESITAFIARLDKLDIK